MPKRKERTVDKASPEASGNSDTQPSERAAKKPKAPTTAVQSRPARKAKTDAAEKAQAALPTRVRRSREEVAKEKAEQAARAQEKIDKKTNNLRQLKRHGAMLQIQSTVDDNNVRRRLKPQESHETVATEPATDVEMGTVSGSQDCENDAAPPRIEKKNVPAKKAPDMGGRKKEAKKTQAAEILPSAGIRSGWKPPQAKKAAPPNLKSKKKVSAGDEDLDKTDSDAGSDDSDNDKAVGGLTNEDADSTRPDFEVDEPAVAGEKLNKAGKTAMGRSKSVVTAIAGDPDHDAGKAPKKTKIAARKPLVPIVPSKPNVKKNSKAAASAVPSLSLANITKPSDFPPAIRGQWQSIFLPTLYAKLYESKDPWDHFTKGHDGNLEVIREIVSTVYKNVNYIPEDDDGVLYVSNRRCLGLRGEIANVCLAMVEEYIDGMRTSDIKSWAQWALSYGNIFFKDPAPEDSPRDKNDPEHVASEGFLQSEFIVKAVKHFLPRTKGSVKPVKKPWGLLALIMTGLERAIRIYKTGKKATEIPQFTRGDYHDRAMSFGSGNFSKFDDEYWSELMKLYSHNIDSSDDECDDDEGNITLDFVRTNLFSPKKSSGARVA